MKTPQEQTTHPPTNCCNYSAPITLPYPVMWNEFNKVVQCHNCGHVWVPKCPELIAVAQAADVILTDYMTYFVDWERMANDKSYKPEYPDNVLKAQAALQALRATGKVEL